MLARLGGDQFLALFERPGGTEIVAATVDLAHALELDVVAEGVEAGEQLSAPSELGCDHAQGYLFSRSVPAAEVQGAFALDQPA